MDWADRYEALRAHALGEAPLGFVPLSLALLRHRGMAAWMAAGSSLEGSRLGEVAGARDEATGGRSLAAGKMDVIRILASMALLGHRKVSV